jgi:hypothetical protein
MFEDDCILTGGETILIINGKRGIDLVEDKVSLDSL